LRCKKGKLEKANTLAREKKRYSLSERTAKKTRQKMVRSLSRFSFLLLCLMKFLTPPPYNLTESFVGGVTLRLPCHCGGGREEEKAQTCG